MTWKLEISGRRYRVRTPREMFMAVLKNSDGRRAAAGHMGLLALLEASRAGLSEEEALLLVQSELDSGLVAKPFEHDRRKAAAQALTMALVIDRQAGGTVEEEVAFVKSYYADPRCERPGGRA